MVSSDISSQISSGISSGISGGGGVIPVAPTYINLSNLTADGLSSGALIGTLSSDGTTPKTYTLTDPSGYFTLVGNQVRIGASAEPLNGEYEISVEVENSAGTHDEPFTLEVVNSPYEPVEPVAPFDLAISNDTLDGLYDGDTIGTLTASGDTPITWTIETDTAGLVALDGSTVKLDSEALDGTYDVVFKATNDAGNDTLGVEFTVVNSPYEVAFDPNSIADWERGYDASTLTAGAVASWPDISGNSQHATQGTGANQPVATAAWSPSGLTALAFDGSNDVLFMPNFGLDGQANMTMFWVGQIDSDTSGADNPIAFGSGSECRLETGGTGSANLTLQAGGVMSNGGVVSTGNTVGELNIFAMRTNGSVVKFYRNGTETLSTTQLGNWTAGAGSYAIGGSGTPNRQMKGHICEVWVSLEALSDANMTVMHDYLDEKWRGL